MIQWNQIKQTIDPGPWSSNGERGLDGRDGQSIVGPVGPQGEPGVDAETIRPVGKWTRIRNYEILDLVTHLGSSYIAREPSKNKTPKEGEFWQLIAQSVKGERGESGPQGNRGRSAQTLIGDVKTGSNFARGLVLYITPSGTAALAKANDQATSKAVVGISTGASSYRTSGPLQKNNWGLTPGAIYYLSDMVAGEITTTSPSANGSMIARVGIALSADVLSIEIAQTIML